MERFEEGLADFGIKYEGWKEAVQKACRWFRGVEDEPGAYMRIYVMRRREMRQCGKNRWHECAQGG